MWIGYTLGGLDGMRVHVVSALFMLALAASCAAPRIEAPNPERARVTIGKVRGSLGETRRGEFNRALDYLMSNGGTALPLLSDPAVRHRIDGKDATAIIAAAQTLRSTIARAEHDAQVRRDLESIRDSFKGIKAGDHPPDASTLIAEEKPDDALIVSKPGGGLDEARALDSEKPLTDDKQILAFCSRYPEDNIFERRHCELEEMKAKAKLAQIIPPAFSPEMASRLRISCAQRAPMSYRERLACIGNESRMVMFVMKQPGALARLPAEYRDDVARIAGIKP